MYLEAFQYDISPYIMDTAINLLSMGVSTINHGLNFVWLGRRKPLYILPTGDRAMVLEIKTQCPHYVKGVTEVWDIRDPRVKELTGVEADVGLGRITLDTKCPYLQSNPELKKPKTSK